MNSRPTYFDKIKYSLLNHKIIAWTALSFIVLTAVLAGIGKYRSVFPVTHVAIRSATREYDVAEYTHVRLPLDIVLSSQSKSIVDDGTVTLDFRVLDEASNSERNLDSSEVLEAFSLDEASYLVPFLDDQNNKAHVDIDIGCQKAGKYRIIVKLKSKNHRLDAEDTVVLNVRPFDIGFLNGLPPNAMPTFALQKGILNVSPRSLYAIGDFRAILLDEAANTNLLRATLWFSEDYVGAMGGFFFNVSADSASQEQIRQRTGSNSIRDYFKASLAEPTAPSTLKSVGAVDGSTDLIPIGSSLYRIRVLDAQRMEFTKVLPDPCKQLVSVEPEQNNLDSTSKLRSTSIPGYGIAMQAAEDAGATGRNLMLRVIIQGETYTDLDGEEGINSDFCIAPH